MTAHAIKGMHLVTGGWVASVQPRLFDAINPTTGEKFSERFYEAGELEVDAALREAQRAFETAKDLPPKWQADFLEAIGSAIMDLGDALLDRGEQETALPRARLTGERGRTVNQLKMFADVVREGSWVDATIDTRQPHRKPLPRPDIRRMMIPRGPAVVFGVSNFPFAFGILGGDTASALAAGCPVVAKGHPSHPGVSELMAAACLAAIENCKLPKGMFALLQGTTHELGAALVKHPLTTAVGFTGSLRAGRALFDLAAQRPRPIPVYAEMGSVNPLVILPGAMAEKCDAVATGLAGSITMGVGQFCTKPGLVFIFNQSAEKFVPALAKAIEATAPGVMLNKMLRDSFCQKAGEFAKAGGATTVVSGSPEGFAGTRANLWETTAKNWLENPKLHEEAFGPGALVVRCDDQQQLLSCLEHTEGSLTATVHMSASDQPQARTILRKLQPIAGRIIINGYPTGVEVNHAIVHGGPYPATTDPGSTSVGSASIRRWVRMIAFQDVPDPLLPPALQNANPLNIDRTVNGVRTRDPI